MLSGAVPSGSPAKSALVSLTRWDRRRDGRREIAQPPQSDIARSGELKDVAGAIVQQCDDSGADQNGRRRRERHATTLAKQFAGGRFAISMKQDRRRVILSDGDVRRSATAVTGLITTP